MSSLNRQFYLEYLDCIYISIADQPKMHAPKVLPLELVIRHGKIR